jgi:hypothetical protein
MKTGKGDSVEKIAGKGQLFTWMNGKKVRECEEELVMGYMKDNK